MTRSEWASAVVEAIAEIAAEAAYEAACHAVGDYDTPREGDAKARLTKLLEHGPPSVD